MKIVIKKLLLQEVNITRTINYMKCVMICYRFESVTGYCHCIEVIRS